MKKIVGCIVLFLFIILQIYCFQIEKNNNKEMISSSYGDVANNVNPSSWVAVDGLGRTIPTSESKSTNHYRAVGIFYWTWHLGQNNKGPYNVNNIVKNNPDKVHDYDWWTNNYHSGVYWWNEPVYGYYMENDDYVLRKQAELLADAGVDFVVFDCTNGTYTWQSAYENLLKVWKEAQDQGINVPRIAFMLQFAYSSNTYTSFMDIYNNLYKPGTDNYNKYRSLFYIFNGKPLILLYDNGAPNDMKEILKGFEVRKVDPTYFITGAQSNGRWGWLSAYPQAYYKKANGQPEQITVGTAQNASYANNTLTAMNGNKIMGRSYANGNYSYSFKYHKETITVGSTITGSTAKSTNTSLYGRNLQQQWDRAIEIDPEIVFVTGWNEWIMGRFKTWQGVTNAFPDQFNDEYSRDIEPSKGDLKDNYYYQLVSNIRKYKGVTSQTKQNTPVTITKTSDWKNSNILSYNHYVGGKTRNIKGYGKTNPQTYVNNTFRNDIKTAKVSYDNSYIYFYVETVNALSSYNSDKWMRLLIDTKSAKNTSGTKNWEEFEYIVNRTTGTKSTLILERSQGGWKFEKVGDVSYRVNNNILEITIPRKSLGLTDNDISFNFKWCDNNLDNGDIMTIYTNGDAAPGGRFAFHFAGTAEYKEISVTPTPTPKPTATPTPTSTLPGDLDLNGKITSMDYVMLRKYILKTGNLSESAKINADMNKDGKINSLDYVAIRKKLIK